MGISHKILLPQIAALGIFIGFLYFVWQPREIENLHEALRAEALVDLDSYLREWQESVEHGHAINISHWMSHIEQERHGRMRARLFAGDGERLYPAQAQPPFPSSLRVTRPWPGREAARMELEVNTAEGLALTRKKMHTLVLLTLCLGGLMLVLMCWVLRRSVVTPLREMRYVAQRIAEGDFKPVLASRARDEIGDLMRMLDDMRQRRAQVDHDLRVAQARAEMACDDLSSYLKVLNQHALVCVLDTAGRILEVNEKLCAVSGFPRDQLLGSEGNRVAPDVLSFRDAICADKGHLWRGEITIYDQGYEIRVMEYVVGGIPGASGKFERYICIGIDVTARTNAMAEMSSAQQFSNAILDSIPEPLAVLDRDGVIISANRTWAQAVGHPHALAITKVGDNYLEFCDRVYETYTRNASEAGGVTCASGRRSFHANAHAFAQGIRAVIEGGREAYQQEYPCDTPCERRWFNGKVAHFNRLKGGALVTHVNISPRKQVEEALQSSEQRLELALEASQTGLWEWDLRRDYVYYSAGWWQALGYAPDTMDNQPGWTSLIHPEDLDQVMAELINHLDQRNARFVSRHRKRNAQGGWEWVQEMGAVVEWDEAGQAQRMVGILQIVTERVVAEMRVQQALDTAQAANAAKSTFLANMGHEVRTPLNGILGMLHLLRCGELSLTELDYVRTAERSGKALLSLLNDLLDYSKLEAGHLVLEQVAFNPQELVEDAVALYAPQAQEKGLEIVCLLSADIPSRLVGDPARLRQVLHNLIGNAVKFTEQGEILVQMGTHQSTENMLYVEPVRHEASEAGKYPLHVSIADTGIGIQEDKKAKLFEAFSQLDDSITRKYGGTGLGLAICSRLVQAMGGEITMSDHAQGGSVFSFSVKMQLAGESSPVEKLSEWRGRRVLIVDSNGSSRMQLQQCLAAWGIRHVSAESEGQARECLLGNGVSNEGFDAVLLAHNPPQLDGLTLARWLAQSQGSPRPRLVLLATMAVTLEVQATQTDDVDAYLAKPVRVGELRNALRGQVKQAEDIVPLTKASELPARTSSAASPSPVARPSAPSQPPQQHMASVLKIRERGQDFMQAAQPGLQRLKEAAAQGKSEQVCVEAHALKLASQNVGAELLVQHCRTLQKTAYAVDAASLQRQIQEIEAAVQMVAQALDVQVFVG